MSQKDVIERLREIISRLESQKDLHLSIDDREDLQKEPRETGLKVIPRRWEGLELKSADGIFRPCFTETYQYQDFKVMKSVFSQSPYLSPVAAKYMGGFRSIWPGIEDLEKWIFMDIETTGLAGTGSFPFLMGFGMWVEGQFVVYQYFVPNRAAEYETLKKVLDDLEPLESRVLCTFNGNSFDIPFINTRLVLSGISKMLRPATHVDLMRIARNLMSGWPGGTGLKECMKCFLGIIREDDVSSNLIPQLYFVYEKDGDESILCPVFKHNLLDIVDLACLSWIWARVLSGEDIVFAGNMSPSVYYGAGKLHFRQKNMPLAQKCLSISIERDPSFKPAKRLLATVLRRQGHWEEAFPLWEELVAGGTDDSYDYLWLSRYYEVYRRDPGKSLGIIETAIKDLECQGRKIPRPLQTRRRRLKKHLV